MKAKEFTEFHNLSILKNDKIETWTPVKDVSRLEYMAM